VFFSYIISHFKQPGPSCLARKRKVATDPPVGKNRSKGKTKNDPKKVSLADHVKLYQKEPLLFLRILCRTIRIICRMHENNREHF
jgi:hypothetical protein